MGGRGEIMNYGNLCLTMHQPWASLLVHGIKRIEGRSWPAPLRGRLWIHAAGKVPDGKTIKAMEDFYREIYAVDGITDLKFPEHYPISRLLGCVDVVGCVKCEELVSWEEVSEGVRLEGQTDFCWLCENPKKLSIPFEMRGFKGVYILERRVYDAAVRCLSSVEGPLPAKFPLPDSRNLFSLKPGSLASYSPGLKISEVEKSPSLAAAIAGAHAAATQYSKQQKYPTSAIQQRDMSTSREANQPKNCTKDYERPMAVPNRRPHNGNSEHNYSGKNCQMVSGANSRNSIQPRRDMNRQSNNRSTEDNGEYGGRVPIHDERPHNINFEHNYNKRSGQMVSGGNSRNSTQPPCRDMNNQSNNRFTEDYGRPVDFLYGTPQNGNSAHNYRQKSGQMFVERNSVSQIQAPHRDSNPHPGAPKRQ